jgi:hypothetical protein
MTIAGARAPEIQLSSRRPVHLPFTVGPATAKPHLRHTIFPCHLKKVKSLCRTAKYLRALMLIR